MRHFALMLLGCFAAFGSAFADDFDTASRLFDDGKFTEARDIYQKMVERGEWSANLFYNLGNTERRLDRPGKAVLDYERALALDPHHSQAQTNLRLLRDRLGSRVITRGWLDDVFGFLPVNAWSMISAAGAWLLILALAMPWALGRKAPPMMIFFAIAGGFIAIFAGVGVWHTQRDRPAGIVVADKAEARFGAASSAGLAGIFPAGSRVHVLSTRGDWMYCEVPGGDRAWLSAGAVELVPIPSK